LSKKQKLGQFFTTNSDYILSGFEYLMKNASVIDPFVGNGDLLNWAMKNGASSVIGYDIEPRTNEYIKNDSIVNPPSYKNKFLVSNPPYLSRNKYKGNKEVFDFWKQDDLYKCHLASLIKNDCYEALIILPTNFWCESRDRIRKDLFDSFYISSAKYWNTPVFDDVSTGITVVHLKRGHRNKQVFEMNHVSENKSFEMILEKRYNYLFGKDFFDYINRKVPKIKIIKTDIGMPNPNTNIVVGLLDKGKWKSGLSYNDNDPIFCSAKSFTTYQITIPNINLTETQQKTLVETFNSQLKYFRHKYHDMFLSNYMGPKQKILSRGYVHELISVILFDMNIFAQNNLICQWEGEAPFDSHKIESAGSLPATGTKQSVACHRSGLKTP
jgi:hypothetical protein